jgi:hypothetical protein
MGDLIVPLNPHAVIKDGATSGFCPVAMSASPLSRPQSLSCCGSVGFLFLLEKLGLDIHTVS